MKKVIKLHYNEEANLLFGWRDENHQSIKEKLAIQIIIRGEQLTSQCEKNNINLAEKPIEEFLEVICLRQHIIRACSRFENKS